MKKERSVLLLSSDKVDKIFINYSVYPQHGYNKHNTDNVFRKKIAYFIFNNAKVIQWAWRTFKLRPETWVIVVLCYCFLMSCK
ncbi:hypothetical protein C1645_841602 [Glomus cerebriforme]|uniref:Uncharacterized protein n=1 Tax=Glomus cerebriforme TaxID=658196 RepID=A0A397S507_9GLOM|nr:hypothetical protein C1645_841602 [Glomus cerebriforme]